MEGDRLSPPGRRLEKAQIRLASIRNVSVWAQRLRVARVKDFAFTLVTLVWVKDGDSRSLPPPSLGCYHLEIQEDSGLPLPVCHGPYQHISTRQAL